MASATFLCSKNFLEVADGSVLISQEFSAEAVRRRVLAKVLSLFSNVFLFPVPSDVEALIKFLPAVLSRDLVTLPIAVSCVEGGAVVFAIG